MPSRKSNLVQRAPLEKESLIVKQVEESSKDTFIIKEKNIRNELSSWERLRQNYITKTPAFIKGIDVYLLFCFLTGILQAVYLLVSLGRHYQSFLGGFIACVGSFVLAASVRLQVSGDKLDRVVPARAIAGFVLGHIILHILIANFI